mgnify:FL=1
MSKVVYVISKSGKPLMPTKRFGKVRRLLKAGKAKVAQRKPFTIQLLYESEEYCQPLALGIDPGVHIGVSVRRENGEAEYLAELDTRTREVPEKLEERRMNRRERRRHRREKRQRRAKKAGTAFETKEFAIASMAEPLVCKWIKPKAIRFHNRSRRDGWLTPTANHLLESHIHFVQKAMKILPITRVSVEYGQFDLQKLDNPDIQSTQYQNGRMKGYSNAREYVLCRDKHTCQFCGKKENVHLAAHHLVWREHGGQDTPENLVTLCEKCHDRVHKDAKSKAKLDERFQGLAKRYVPATLLNTIMPRFCDWLVSQFQEVKKTYGYETKEKRQSLGLPKKHCLDAYLASWEVPSSLHPSVSEFIPYQFQEFRRHNRQTIHATRDRNYKLDKKIVAKNRRKRTGQLADSLQEFVASRGLASLHLMAIYPGTKVRRSRFDLFRRGDVVLYQGKVAVVKGYGEMGRSLGFVSQKQYVPAKNCSLMLKNTGIVCL